MVKLQNKRSETRHFYISLRSCITHNYTNNVSKNHILVIKIKLVIPFSDKYEHIFIVKRVTRLLIIRSTSSRFLRVDRRFFNETSEKIYNNFQCG
jgi:hypothetical protein